MSKQRCNVLGMMLVSFASLLAFGGCGGSSSSSTPSSNPTPSVNKATISGSVTFPTLNSLVKQVAADAAVVPTIELRDLSGALVATTTATGTGPYLYSFTGIDPADYVVKASIGTKVVKALVDKDSITTTTTTTRNIDAVATTALLLAEQKLGVPAGTIGEKANSISSVGIASVKPQVLESSVVSASAAIKNTPTQDQVNLVNLRNVVTAAVISSIDPATLFTGAPTTATVSTTQYTYVSGAAPTSTTTTVTQATAQAVAATTTPTNGYIQYRTTESSPLVVGWIAVDPSVYTSATLKNSNGAIVQPATGYVVTATSKMDVEIYDCFSGTACVSGKPVQDIGYGITLPITLAAGKYAFELKTATGTESKPLTYTTGLSVPVIKSSVMSSTNSSSDISFTWQNPTTDATWGSVTALRVLIADSKISDKRVYVYLKPSAQSVTVPRSVVTQAGINPDSATLQWQTQTRQYINNVNVARGQSNWKPIAPYSASATSTPVAPAGSTPIKASLLSGWYQVRSDSSSNTTTSKITNYYYIEKFGLATDGVTMTRSITSYLDPVSKTWTTTVPVGFPSNNNSGDLALNAKGAWVADNNGPAGYTAVFNADGSARITNPISGSVIDATVSSVSIAGQSVSSNSLNGASLLAFTPVFPSGAVGYNMTITSVNDSYSVWSSISSLTSLSAIPAMYAENSSNSGSNMWIDDNDPNNYYYAKFVSGSSTNVNIYKGINSSTGTYTAPVLIGTATAATVTVLGNQIFEINIPASLRTTYQLSGNPIFAVVNGVVMEGSHSIAGKVDVARSGEGMYNDIAINHIKANISIPLAPLVAKSISKSLLGW